MDVCWEEAVRRGDADVMRDLLSRGIDPNARDPHGQTGLMLAAHAGHVAAVQLLVDHRVDLNVTAKFGLSAVMLAVTAGHKEIARVLARAGADLRLRGTGAPGFAGKTAADLAGARGWNDLAIELAPDNKPGMT
jgi:ankyrin repeat protein